MEPYTPEVKIVATVKILKVDPSGEMVYIIKIPRENGHSEYGGVINLGQEIEITSSDLKGN